MRMTSLSDHADQKISRKILAAMLLASWLSTVVALSAPVQEPGVTETTIRIGAIMPLEGDAKFYGLNMKKGIEAALANQIVQGRKVEFEALNNFDELITTIEVARRLVEKGVFIMLGNVGTLTSMKLMPLLVSNEIPAVGFYTAGELDKNDNILDFRPGHVREITDLINAAVNAGVKASQICLFGQNDADGLAAINGLKAGLMKLPNTQTEIENLDKLTDTMWGGINPARNDMGPVGLYLRGTTRLRDGYQSLKNWEKASGESCRLVIIVATPKMAADFITYALYKKEPWSFSAISATASGDSLKNLLLENNIRTKVIITQVVPALDADLPIVADARNALGIELNPVNLEGYIIGRMFLNIMRSINGPITRINFMKAARRQPFDLGGLKIDFTKSHRGSSLVLLKTLNGDRYGAFSVEDLKQKLRN